MTIVKDIGYASLVSIRPVAADLIPSIKEGRDVQLQGKGMLEIMAP